MKFGKWVQTSAAPDADAPAYVCGQCGGSEHLYGAAHRERKMVCDECGCVNSYPWEKILDKETDDQDRWIHVRKHLPKDNQICYVCGKNGAQRVARAHVLTPQGNVPFSVWWTKIEHGYTNIVLDISPIYWMPAFELPEGVQRCEWYDEQLTRRKS